MKLQDVRPVLGTFTLRVTDDVEHRFRKIGLDDEIWAEDTFGMGISEFFAPGRDVKLSDICRMWFHFLDDQSHFPAKKKTVPDDENGGTKEVVVPGFRVFLQAIDEDEVKAVAAAFEKSMKASRTSAAESSDDKKKAK